MKPQNVDLYAPIVAARPGPQPVAVTIGVKPAAMYGTQGSIANTYVPHTYVLLSALPTELQERVKLAVQAIIAGM